MEKPAYIYALTDPDTGDVRYVGKTNDLAGRLRRHILPSALAKRCRRTNWLNWLLKAGKMPCITLLEEVSQDRWKERECYWIAFYRGIGAQLVNTAEGGGGGVRSEWITEEWRANMSKARMGYKRSAESIEKQRAKLIGVPRTPETIAKMSLANKGKKPSVQCEEARLKVITGRKHSDEWRQKASARLAGNLRAKRNDYIATDPKGADHQVENLTEFCAAKGLTRSRMSSLANGDSLRTQHKGWKCRLAVQ